MMNAEYIFHRLNTIPKHMFRVGESKNNKAKSIESNGLVFVINFVGEYLEVFACTEPEHGFNDPFVMPDHPYVQTMITPKEGQYARIFRGWPEGYYEWNHPKEEWQDAVEKALDALDAKVKNGNQDNQDNSAYVLQRALAAQKRLNSET